MRHAIVCRWIVRGRRIINSCWLGVIYRLIIMMGMSVDTSG
jgi:hypothetical protein